MSKPLDDKIQFRREIFLAFVITGLACAAGFSNLLFASSDLYPSTADAMGHMAKVRYIAECFSNGEFPAWFPYWYNGSTVTQYYPPLSYWVMAPIFMITNSAMLTFKIYCFTMIFIGGIGVWYFCRLYIGQWCGLFGTIIYCIQPFILRSLYSAGTVAQGPIIALTPWYIILLLAFGRKSNAKNYFFCTIICALMILGHPNTAFMICFCVVAAFLFVFILKKITAQNYLFLITTIIFSGVLTAFWSLVGVTGFENKGIPYLLPEAALNYTANIKWYTSLFTTFFYFAIPISIGSCIATLLYIYRTSRKKTSYVEGYYVLTCIFLTFISVLFSFGLNLPFFKYLPLSDSLVPGRILVLTAFTGAVLCSYLIYSIQSFVKEKKIIIKMITFLFCLSLIGTTLYFMNPYESEYKQFSDDSLEQMFSKVEKEGDNFEKGRYAYIGAVDCSETYFPLSYDFNINDGWNIEGTPHNRAIWNNVIADPSNCYDYIAKNLTFWNVRYLLLGNKFDKVAESLNNGDIFKLMTTRGEHKFYASNTDSSYFLIDHRSSLIFGAGAPAVAMEFPYLVYEQRNDISDYTFEELKNYKLIYLCEPEVNTIQDKKNIEDIIGKLIEKGVNVVIEPTNINKFAIFDVTVSDVNLEESPIIKKQSGVPIKDAADVISVDEKVTFARALFGLDRVHYKLIQNDNRLKNDVIGTKKVGDGEVLFIGMHLSQNLKAVYARNWGVPENESGYPECSDEVKALFTDIFKTYGVNTDFWPDPFPVTNADWNYKGVDLQYSSQKAQEMTVSVTYTPRWKATLDGKPLEVGQKENLITLDLPTGNHEVKLVYGITKYGIAGYMISVVGLLIFILFIKFYDIILDIFRQICVKFSKFLQLDNQND